MTDSAVKDRRSATGGKQPTRISDDELAMMRHLANEKAAAAAFYERAQAAEEAGMRHLIRKYGLAGQDSVSLETGVITRTPAGSVPGGAE